MAEPTAAEPGMAEPAAGGSAVAEPAAAQILRGAPVATAVCEDAAARARALAGRGVTPRLAIVRVGARPDDLSYERAAVKRCGAVGVDVTLRELPEDCDQGTLEATLAELGAAADVHGILLFRPLPRGLDEAAACAAIPAEKDVDAATPASLLATLSGAGAGFAPCTAEAVIALLDHYGVGLEGAEVCVVGRSLVIGRPVAALLVGRNATVTLCHTRTRDLAACCRRADVVVAAAGSARLLGADCARAGQVVVDVGTTWDEGAGRLVGDVDLEAVAPVVSAITPVPGGVGAVTTAVLARHVVEAAEGACR